jgi:uncharacterized protein (TIGR02145 family)
MRYATAYTYGIPLAGFENITSPTGSIAVDTEGSRGFPSIANGTPINFVGGVSDYYDDNAYIVISDTTTAGLVGRSGDGSNLPVVTIGTQSWMTSNLDVTNYRNGDIIPEITDPTAWSGLTTGAWCWYNNNSANGTIYGRLYNWYAVNDPRGLAPAGYRVPTDAEWLTLMSTLGGSTVAGGAMKSTSGWNAPNTDATNSSGFTSLPGGSRNGSFGGIGRIVYYWSSSEIDSLNAIYFSNFYLNADLFQGNFNKSYGISVRCIKDNNSVGVAEQVPTFWASKLKTDISFLDLVNRLPQRSGQDAFANNVGGLFSASDWLLSNGYWTSYIAPILSLDAGNTASYSLDNATVWRDLVDGKEFNLLGDQGLPTYESGNGGKILFVATASNYAICNTSLPQMVEFTLSIWHYWNGNNTGTYPCIISEIFTGTVINYLLGIRDGGLRGGYYKDANGFILTPTFSLTPNNWYHIVITCGRNSNPYGYNQAIKAYVNNILVVESLFDDQAPYPQSSGSGIHLMRWDLADFWDGYLAKVDIYNRALSQRQITSVWNSNRSRFGL